MKTTKNHLKKALGLGFGIAIMVGSTIGVGILRTPSLIAGLLDNSWLIIACWLIAGGYILMGAGTFIELATMMPKAGGAFNYVERAFGKYAGFITGWFDYISNAISPAFFCIVIAEYMAVLIPGLKNQTTVIAIAFIIAFTLLHASGVKNGSVVQQITSIIKVLFFVALIVACFTYSGVQISPLQSSPVILNVSIVVSFFKSLQLIFGTYDGWVAVSYFSEEDENPSVNIPRSFYLGAAVLIGIYTIINIAFLYVLPPSVLANSSLAASEVANVVFGKSGAIIVTLIAVFSIISILNAYMMIPARVLFGLSRNGFFIKQGAIVNKGGTPIVGLLISSAFALILICIGTFEVLFSLATFMGIMIYGLVYISLVKLRIAEPDFHRPHKAWGYPYTSIVMILISVVLLTGFAYSDQKSFLTIGLIILLSYPVFLGLRRLNK